MAAEQAANAGGSIPAWAGSPITAPAGWTVRQARPDPCAHEPPLFSMGASNAAQHSQHLSAGQFVTGMAGHTLLSTEHGATLRELVTGTDQSLPDAVEPADGRHGLVGLGDAVAFGDPVSGFTATIRPERLAATSVLPSDKRLLLFDQAGVRVHSLPGRRSGQAFKPRARRRPG